MIGTVIDFILHIDQHLTALSAQYGMWIYAILFLIIFCETGLVATPFLPGDSLLFAAGGIAAVGEMNIHIMVLILLVAAILGDAVNFMIGKYFGAKLFSNPDSKIFRRAYLEKPMRSTKNTAARPLSLPVLFRLCAPLPRSWPVWATCITAGLSATTSSARWHGYCYFRIWVISLPIFP